MAMSATAASGLIDLRRRLTALGRRTAGPCDAVPASVHPSGGPYPHGAVTDLPTELLAAYWTLAGDVYPGGPSEVSRFPLEARAAAAAAAGWTGMGLVHEDLRATLHRLGYAGIRRVLGEHGIRHLEVEFLSDWDADPGTPARRASDRVRHELLEAAGELGARNLKVSPHLFAEPPPDRRRIRDAFAAVCNDAASAGTKVVLEIMPFTDVRTIQDGLAVVGDAPNGGLLLDIWHVARGAIALADVAGMPAGRLLAVELDDAGPPVGDPFDDTRFRRRLPGEGGFDIPAFLGAVAAAGFAAPYLGVEIISEAHRQRPLDVMARTAFEATTTTIQRARLRDAE